jgi:hypothetical protein
MQNFDSGAFSAAQDGHGIIEPLSWRGWSVRDGRATAG